MKLFYNLKPSLKKKDKNKEIQIELQPIRTADELLIPKDCAEFIKTIKLLIKSSNRFSHFYLPVIKKFAEFVQNITESQHDFFSCETSFLEHSLERASRTLSLSLKHFFPEEINFANISNKDALWIYATFTAALFLDIGKIATKYSIMIYHKKRHLIKEWNPYVSSMLGQGSYYKFNYIKENLNDLRYFITPILARQILDSMVIASVETNGFNWIASDREVLGVWLSLLSGEEDRIPMTSFMSMIPRADIDMIENYKINSQIAITDPAGEAFLQWLRNELVDRRISINGKDEKIRIIEGKIFLSTVLFQDFKDANPTFNHSAVIEKQFIEVAKLYQIPISELYQRSRGIGGISGQSDSGKRYRAVGGFSVTHENEKNSQQRVLQGDMRLIFLLTSHLNSSINKITNLDLSTKNWARA